MVVIGVDGANAAVRKQDVLTVGMVGAKAEFRFDEKWDGLGKTAVFRQGNVTKDAAVFDGTVTIPWEALQLPGIPVSIGVYGTNGDGSTVIPTVWTKTAPVQPGTDPSGDESADPSLPLWAQMQAQLNSMYRSSEEINAAKEEMLQAIEDGKADIRATVAAGDYYTKGESGAKFASAITGARSGEVVAASDVSPVEHVVSVKASGEDLSNVKVTRCGKNLIKSPYSANSTTSYGVAFTPKADGTVEVKGTATASAYFVLNGGFAVEAAKIPSYLKPGNKYTIKDASLFLYSADGTAKAFGAGTFTMPEDCVYYGIFVHIYSGQTVDKLFMPQLELGDSVSSFEPYVGQSYDVAEDGTVEGVTSLAPGMTLYAEKPGIQLDVKYNRDSNAVIAELLEKMFPAARIISVPLPASKWVGSGTLYSQVVSIAGVTANSQVNLTPSVEQLSIFYEKDLTFITENDGGVVTVYVIGQKPQNDYTIQADVVEVTT